MRPYDTLPRRPNGRPQACDPCRRRKVACGHGQPVCMRCTFRNQERDCTYKYTAGHGSRPSRSRRAATPSRAASSSSSEASAGRSRRHLPLMSQPAADAAPALRTPEDPVAPLHTVDGRPGYLGLTSHSAVYAETRSCLSILQDFPSWLLPEGSDRQDAQQPWDDSELLASPARDMWLVVLRSLPTPSVDNISAYDSPR